MLGIYKHAIRRRMIFHLLETIDVQIVHTYVLFIRTTYISIFYTTCLQNFYLKFELRTYSPSSLSQHWRDSSRNKYIDTAMQIYRLIIDSYSKELKSKDI